jgi:hypothetical protein
MQIAVHSAFLARKADDGVSGILRGGVTPRGTSKDGKMLDPISTAVH